MLSCLSGADLDRLIAEDLPHGDLTTETLQRTLGPGLLTHGGRQCRIRLSARVEMRVCGIEEAYRLFERLGAQAECHVASGRTLPAGSLLLSAHGGVAAVFAGWKLAQTLIEWASGIATAVANMVEVVQAASPDTIVACTRKTAPFTRGLAVKAVRAGGGNMHRLNLSDSLLLFPEHAQLFDAGISLPDAASALRRVEPERSLVAEVLTVEQAQQLAAHVQVLQLEKFSVTDVAEVATFLKQQSLSTVLAAAGGINVDNAAAYAAAGARVLVTSWPYQARPRDVQVQFHVT